MYRYFPMASLYVWSAGGPVLVDDVFPWPVDQSNLSVLEFVHPQRGGLVSSKEHSTVLEENQNGLISLFSHLQEQFSKQNENLTFFSYLTVYVAIVIAVRLTSTSWFLAKQSSIFHNSVEGWLR